MSATVPRRRGGQVALRVVGSLLAALALVAGVAQLVAVWAHGEYRVTTSFAASEIDTVEVTTAQGTVHVIGDDSDRVVVRVDVSDGLVATDRDARVEGRKLVLDARCPWLGQWWCSADYTVHVPRSTTVIADSDDGSVRVTDVDGTVDTGRSR